MHGLGSALRLRGVPATLLAIGLAWACGCGDAVPSTPRNVILISIDTLRAGLLGC